MKLSEEQQKIYDIKKAELLLKKHDLLDKNQEKKNKDEIEKVKL